VAKKTTKHSSRVARGSGNPVEDALASMERGWKDTEARTGVTRFPPGRGYTGYVQNVLIETNRRGNLQVHWTIAGECKELTKSNGESMVDHKWSNMSTDDNRAWLRGEMEAIDLTWPDSPRQLGTALDDAVGARILFDVVDTKTDEFDNHNIYFRERLEGEGQADGDDGGDDEDAWTEDEIRNMSEEDMDALARQNDIDPDQYETWDEVADLLVELNDYRAKVRERALVK